MKKCNKLTVVLLIFFFITIFLPLLKLISTVELGTFNELISSKQFKMALSNSLFFTSISTVISISIAYMLAYAINRTNIKRKSLLSVLFVLPMLIPSISHGVALINLFGSNGIITDLNIFGIKGIIMGSVLYSFPVAFLMLNDAFKYVDNSLYENCRIIGINGFQTVKKITLVCMKKSILSSIFAVFTLIFTDYGIPLSIGGNYTTLPVFLYKQVIGLLNFSKGTIIGLFLLIPALISFIFDLVAKDYSANDSNIKEYKPVENKLRDIIFNLFVYSVVLILFILLGSFIYMAFLKDFPNDLSFSFDHFKYLIDNNIFKYFFNSIVISIFAAIIGTIITFLSAYITSRSTNKLKKMIHIMATIAIAVPGIVLGLSYAITFKNTFIYNTLIIIIICNIIHFLSTPYLMAYNALGKIDKNYEDSGFTCNISIFQIIKNVLVPISKITILEMFSYIFVNSMITISAVAFLYNSSTTPLSILINRYENSLMLEETAIISLIILTINLVMKGTVYIIKRIDHNRRRNEINIQ